MERNARKASVLDLPESKGRNAENYVDDERVCDECVRKNSRPTTSIAMMCACPQDLATPPASVNGRRISVKSAISCIQEVRRRCEGKAKAKVTHEDQSDDVEFPEELDAEPLESELLVRRLDAI